MYGSVGAGEARRGRLFYMGASVLGWMDTAGGCGYVPSSNLVTSQ